MDKKKLTKIKNRALETDNPPAVPSVRKLAQAAKKVRDGKRAARKSKREDVNQAAARIVRQATDH